MKKILRLHPHKHTGKLLHHRHTSYPALFLLLALAGAVLLTPVGMARADSYLVSAVVPAPLPTDPAVITSPPNGSTVTQGNVTIRGNCPIVDPPIIVVLYDGSTIIGSQYCGTDGTFAITVSLSPGSHSIVPQIVNFTGQTGPTGAPILITYIPPVVTTTTTTSTTVTTHTTETQPEIITDGAYVLYGPNKDAVWKGTIRGGRPPYRLTINWGDGTIETKNNLKPGAIALRHHYSQLKMYQIRILLQDSLGQKFSVSIVAISPAAYNSYASSPVIAGNTLLSRNWLLYALYVVTVVALLMFWHRERLHYAQQVVPITRRRTAAKSRRR